MKHLVKRLRQCLGVAVTGRSRRRATPRTQANTLHDPEDGTRTAHELIIIPDDDQIGR